MIITYTNASHDDKDKELLTPHVGLHGWLFLSSSSVTDGSIGLGYIIHSWKRTKTPYNSIFPLRLNTHAHTSRVTSAHERTYSTQKYSVQKCFCTYFIHIVPNITEESW